MNTDLTAVPQNAGEIPFASDELTLQLDAIAPFPENQQRALLALARGLSQGSVAKLAGVSTRTIRSWEAMPEFEAARKGLSRCLRRRELEILVRTFPVAKAASQLARRRGSLAFSL